MRMVSFFCMMLLVGGIGIVSVPGDPDTMLLEPVSYMPID